MVANYAIDADWSIYVQSIARREAAVAQSESSPPPDNLWETIGVCPRSVEQFPKSVSSRSCIIAMSKWCSVQQVIKPVSPEAMPTIYRDVAKYKL